MNKDFYIRNQRTKQMDFFLSLRIKKNFFNILLKEIIKIILKEINNKFRLNTRILYSKLIKFSVFANKYRLQEA